MQGTAWEENQDIPADKLIDKMTLDSTYKSWKIQVPNKYKQPLDNAILLHQEKLDSVEWEA